MALKKQADYVESAPFVLTLDSSYIRSADVLYFDPERFNSDRRKKN